MTDTVDPPAVVDTLELRMAGIRRRLEGLGLMVDNVVAAQRDRTAAADVVSNRSAGELERTTRYIVVDNLRRLQLAIAPLLLDAARLLAAAEDAELELGQPQ